MVTALSDLLRAVLAHQQANFLSLREELALTKQYLAIQQIRFEDRLTVELQVDTAKRRAVRCRNSSCNRWSKTPSRMVLPT